MTLKDVQIQGIKGIEFERFSAGALTVITGENGSGKSSCLDAIRAVFEGGHDPSLIRLGCHKGEILLTLDDGTTIRKTITEKGSMIEIKTAEGLPVPAPQTFLATLAASFAFDPLMLMTIGKKKRAEFLLDAMPINFTAAELQEAGVSSPLGGKQWQTDLAGLDKIRSEVYERRKMLNKSVRDAEGTIASLQSGLPENDATDWGARLKALDAEAADVEAQVREAERATEADKGDAILAASADIDDRIEELRREKARLTAEIQGDAAKKLRRIADVAQPERDRLSAEREAARQQAQAQAKSEGARKTVENMRQAVRVNFLESEAMTKRIAALDDLRRRKLDALPIEGIEVRDGDVFVGGVPFDSLNTAQQMILAIKLAKLKLGKLPLLVVDRSESIDPETWPQFCEAVRDSGLQVIAARVADGPLKVESE